MTADEFRKMALALPDAIESSHMAHPDFRVGVKGKIFATLWYPDKEWAMVKLKPMQQAQYAGSSLPRPFFLRHPEKLDPTRELPPEWRDRQPTHRASQ